jgi:intracellular septation protein
MKQFLDYIPLIIFFIVWSLDERIINVAGFEYTLGGIFSAAEFLLVTSILVYGAIFFVQKRLEKLQIVTLVIVVLACIPTIYFRNTDYLKWKAPIVNWLFAAAFLGSRFFSDKSAIEHMMGHSISAPKHVWHTLNSVWIVYFIVLGAVNLAVAFTLSESMWINFKVWGNLIITFVFVFAQMPYLSKYIELEEEDEDPSASKLSPP